MAPPGLAHHRAEPTILTAAPVTKQSPREWTHHGATKQVFRDWLQANYGRPVGVRVDWQSMGPREILGLSEEMFDAAGVPQAARDTYYGELTHYLYSLG